MNEQLDGCLVTRQGQAVMYSLDLEEGLCSGPRTLKIVNVLMATVCRSSAQKMDYNIAACPLCQVYRIKNPHSKHI